ncbi:cysteine-rich KTR domain-containing protein [Kineothrix sp. MB12-C1]|uniref:cysteine-rich KTR domain-containing protein n=1 Tax=Kineothrix sp. MB12-C1 TaxID=3070215 RepID=UPI003FA55E4A
MQGYKWYICPKCGRGKLFPFRQDTKVENFPGYCKRCKQESIITIEPKSRIVNS